MVKVVPPAGNGSEIVRLADLVGNTSQPGAIAGSPAPVSALNAAQDAIHKMDSWINLADKGITMLGRVDSILSRVQTLKGQQQPANQQQVPQGPPPMLQQAPPDMKVNADPPQPVQPAPQAQGPVPFTPPRPCPGIGVMEIADALKMIDQVQPGITCAQLAVSIQNNPAGVQNILNTYFSAAKK